MKIQNKLLIGGLMTAVSCGLVGSITGTFAWYQYSLNATAALKGVSIKTTQDIQLAVYDGTNAPANNAWVSGNLSWAAISGGASVNFTPVTNGTNAGNGALNNAWYGNPNGVTLPALDNVNNGSGYYYTFQIAARIKEQVGSAEATYPAGSIKVSNIHGSCENNTIKNALTMHLSMGNTNAVFNPTKAGGDSVSLSASQTVTTTYIYGEGEGETVTSSKTVKYEIDSTNQVVIDGENTNVGSLVRQAHSLAESNLTASFEANSFAVITATVWLEGFALDVPAQGDADAWWNDTVANALTFYAGFELTATKA